MYSDIVYTAATSMPVTLTEVHKQLTLGEDITYHDAMLTGYMQAATEYIERYCNRALVTQTRELQIDRFPCGTDPIYLKPPLTSVTHIKYLQASDGVETTWTNTNYRVLTSMEPGKIVPAWEVAYPATRGIAGAITIRYVTGQAVASVPTGIKQAILLLVSNWFENRTPIALGTISTDIEFTLGILLESHRVADDFIRYESEAFESAY